MGCAKKKDAGVDAWQLEERDDLFYFEDAPFTGVAVWKHENGQKKGEGTLKDGKRHGLQTYWHKNGQKANEFTYKDGNLISSKRCDEDGNPK